ncbi:hypothetical protein BG261_02860 [Floricoccus tropicus]|uniref:HNHc nuclease n=1 Tax=Floricoccus tropicus TaxID=1859473 RepID=A0A1E8GNF6_9LACT|nr:putative HNHc nuclease [Floricoccus tropicus]OFI49536.1 hypothetical protein BG261_02860 [Floricoccus tropicus]
MEYLNKYTAVVRGYDDDKLLVQLNEKLDINRLSKIYEGFDEYPREVIIKFQDPRKVSERQRKFFFALLNDISMATDHTKSSLQEYFYSMYEDVTGDAMSLSASNTSVSDVTFLINLVLDFIFENDIPFKEGYEILPENQDHYFYKCIMSRTCCICGKHAEIDHFDHAVGRRNRNKIDNTQFTFAALCSIHHQEKHIIGVTEFKNKYHMWGVKLDADDIKKMKIGGYAEEDIDES